MTSEYSVKEEYTAGWSPGLPSMSEEKKEMQTSNPSAGVYPKVSLLGWGSAFC